ncbi:hypothetical protein WJ976_33580 (plasmid) [Achromobacter denitrificans]|nr:hypothetical protein [Achromobacter aegrifaciens]
MDLATAAASLQAPLDVLALFKLADEFYTKEERTTLYKEYEQLRAADEAAFAHMKSQQESLSGMTFEERVAKHGPAVAAVQLDPSRKAHEARLATMNRVTAFEKEHRLLIRLLVAKASYSKSQYE